MPPNKSTAGQGSVSLTGQTPGPKWRPLAAILAQRQLLLPFGGAVAQLGERLVRNEEVRGSNPLGSTTYRQNPQFNWASGGIKFSYHTCCPTIGNCIKTATAALCNLPGVSHHRNEIQCTHKAPSANFYPFHLKRPLRNTRVVYSRGSRAMTKFTKRQIVHEHWRCLDCGANVFKIGEFCYGKARNLGKERDR
jgi:hypothetical protein